MFEEENQTIFIIRSSKVRYIVFEEEHQTIFIMIGLTRIEDMSVDRNLSESQPTDDPKDPMFNHSI